MSSASCSASAALVATRIAIEKHKASEAALSDRISAILTEQRDLQAELGVLRQQREGRNLAAALAGEAIPDEDAGCGELVRTSRNSESTNSASILSRAPTWQSRQHDRARELIAEGMEGGLAVRFAAAETSARRRLSRLLGHRAAMTAEVAVGPEGRLVLVIKDPPIPAVGALTFWRPRNTAG